MSRFHNITFLMQKCSYFEMIRTHETRYSYENLIIFFRQLSRLFSLYIYIDPEMHTRNSKEI